MSFDGEVRGRPSPITASLGLLNQRLQRDPYWDPYGFGTAAHRLFPTFYLPRLDLSARRRHLGQARKSKAKRKSKRKSKAQRKSKKEYPWAPLAAVLRAEPEAARLGVSEVARSPRGFVRAYEALRSRTASASVPLFPNQTWGQRRHNFVKRHLAQYRQNPTERRRLALLMWAYKV